MHAPRSTRLLAQQSSYTTNPDDLCRLCFCWIYPPSPPPNVQNFHHSPSTGDANQHRRDMELQRLNVEPRMMLEAEAWSNLNAGESSADQMMLAKVSEIKSFLQFF